VEAFAQAFFDPKAQASKLSYYCHPARERFTKRYKLLRDERASARAARAQAEADGNTVGLKQAETLLGEIGKGLDQLDLFRKNLTGFVRSYEFLSQIVSFEDAELEQLCVFARTLVPLLRQESLDDDDIDISEVELTHYRLTKRKEHELRLADEDDPEGLDPITGVGTGKPHDPEKKRLSEIIETLNDLFGAEVSDEDQLHFANGIADRVRRDEAVMAQVDSHSTEQVMHGLFPKRLTDLVLDSMTDHEKLSMEILESDVSQRKFALLILRLLSNRDFTQFT
jgi:type I restriction enzyme R subunit